MQHDAWIGFLAVDRRKPNAVKAGLN